MQWYTYLGFSELTSPLSHEELNGQLFLLTVKFLHELQHKATRLFLIIRSGLRSRAWSGHGRRAHEAAGESVTASRALFSPLSIRRRGAFSR